MIDWKTKAMQYAADNGYTWGSSGLKHEYMYVGAAIEECARVAERFEDAEFGYNPTAVKIAAAIRTLLED